MRSIVLALAAVLLAAAPVPAAAADCAKTNTGLTPIPELGAASYKGVQGGLYPGGTNSPPAAYAAEGHRSTAQIVPRAAMGAPDPAGKVVLLSIGMSNTTQEFSTFVRLAQTDAVRDADVVIVDGAQGGQDARVWADPKQRAWVEAGARLTKAGVTAAQVQAVWLKQAIGRPSGDFAESSALLEAALVRIVENAKARYPNLAQIFLSPRTYAGYAVTELNPEPYAYETAFAVKRLVERSVREPGARPWIGWGPYLWTDGTKGRADGLTWTCADVSQDGVHPSASGEAKVARLLQTFFNGSEFTSWYRDTPATLPSAETVAPGAATAAAQAGEPASPGLPVIAPWVYALAALVIGGAAAVTLRLTRRGR